MTQKQPSFDAFFEAITSSPEFKTAMTQDWKGDGLDVLESSLRQMESGVEKAADIMKGFEAVAGMDSLKVELQESFIKPLKFKFLVEKLRKNSEQNGGKSENGDSGVGTVGVSGKKEDGGAERTSFSTPGGIMNIDGKTLRVTRYLYGGCKSYYHRYAIIT